MYVLTKGLQHAASIPHPSTCVVCVPPPRLPVVHQVESLKAQRAEAKGNAYREYVVDKHLAFVSDPTNMAFEELELPQVIQVS